MAYFVAYITCHMLHCLVFINDCQILHESRHHVKYGGVHSFNYHEGIKAPSTFFPDF